jgi:hypothetical protein
MAREKRNADSKIVLVDCYRNKTRAAIESTMADVHAVAPHFETRPGKRRWVGRMKRGAKNGDD